MPRPLLRTLRALVISAVAIPLLTIALIKGSMVMARIHVQHLLTDFQSIQPMQSNWADAQRLMHRWGRWGSYQGTCTARDCTFDIQVDDGIDQQMGRLSAGTLSALYDLRVISFLGLMGWHSTRYSVSFTVQDGLIVRTTTTLWIQVPPRIDSAPDRYGYGLQLRTKVHSRLTVISAIHNYGWILGSPGTPTDHPDYKVGRPGGCKICLSGELTYTPTLAHAEIIRLTSYNLSCITRWRSCRTLEDVLPAAIPWHLYGDLNDDQANAPQWPPAKSCSAPPRALARDADLILEADVLSTQNKTAASPATNTPYTYQAAQLRVRSILKGSAPFSLGQEITVTPYTHTEQWDTYTSEEFTAGTHPIVVFQRPIEAAADSYEATPCAILPDTPEILAQVRFGISQDQLTRFGDTWDHQAPRYSSNR